MARKLPPDFDPGRYLADYPDVALSGLDPAEHYLMFGQALGRPSAPKPKPKPKPALEPPQSSEAAEVSQPAKPAKPKPDQPKLAEPKPTALKTPVKPIIDRPADFDPREMLVRPAPPRDGAEPDGTFSFESVAESVAEQTAVDAYKRLVRLAADGPKDAAGGPLRTPSNVANAWITSDGVLRLIVDDPGTAEGAIVRAFQAQPSAPARLHLLPPGARLPKRGPALIEFELKHGLMPLLLEISGSDDAVRELTLLPFPSLLPGGVHGAELKALQADPSPMDAFWSLSDLLLRELWDDGGPELSIGRIVPCTDAEPSVTGVSDWLKTVFGFQPEAKGGTLCRAAGSAELLLPGDCLPTISALTARRLGNGTAPYLVAETGTLRARWSVILPRAWDAGGSAPVLTNVAVDGGSSTPLAIAVRPLPAPYLGANAAPKKRRGTAKVSVLLDATDRDRTMASIAALRTIFGTSADLMVRGSAAKGDWRIVEGDLAAASASAVHELLLTISDKVDLGDAGVLDFLLCLLDDPKVASASCVLLREISLKKQKVLQPATGGLFPAGVAFAGSPSLTFNEPDVLHALPSATYPVVANTLHLTLWRKSVLADLGRPRQPLPATAEDIHLGLALAERGLSSVCTTEVSARIAGEYIPRDVVDPIGQSRLGPADWQGLLERVTVLRQLF